MTLEEFLKLLQERGLKPRQLSSGQWLSLCPAHSDTQPSLSVALGESGKILLHCFADCTVEEICHALGITLADLQPNEKSLTLTELARAKLLPKQLLHQLGWREENNAVAIPFILPNGTRVFQFRHSLNKTGVRYTWSRGAKASNAVYGLDQLHENVNEVWVTESALDTVTLQFVGVHAIAVAGQGNAKAVAHFADKLSRVDKIIVWQEPDAPNFARDIAAALGRSVFCVQPEEGMPKDANRLWLSVGADKAKFLAELSRLRERAIIVEPTFESHQTDVSTDHNACCPFCGLTDERLLELAKPVLDSDNPIAEAVKRISQSSNIVAEERNIALLLLTLTTRLLPHPTNALVVGTLGQGKSFLVDAVCKVVPKCRHRRIVGTSARALLFHPIMPTTVIEWLELPNIGGDTIAATVLRALLWQEGAESAEYLLVEATPKGLRKRVLHLPTQVCLISTRMNLPSDDQLASRFLLVEVREDAEKRKAVHRAIGEQWVNGKVNNFTDLLVPLQAFNEWAQRRQWFVRIPFAITLTTLLSENPPSERDYRDATNLLRLVAASAIWNWQRRKHEVAENTIIVEADLGDYALVRELVLTAWSRPRSFALTEGERKVAETIQRLHLQGKVTVTAKEVAEVLQISERAVRKYFAQLLAKDLVEEAESVGRTKRWRLVGDLEATCPPLLPTVETVRERWLSELTEPVGTSAGSAKNESTDYVFGASELTEPMELDRKSVV